MSDLSLERQKATTREAKVMSDKDRTGSPKSQMQELDDSHKKVWIKDGDIIRPVVIEVGIDDGSNTEVISGLEEGNIVVSSFELTKGKVNKNKNSKDDEQKSPFVQERGGGGPPR